MSKLKKILIFGIFVLVLVGVTSFFTTNKLENERLISFISPTEWSTYRNADVEFKYPKDWVLVDGVPSNFQKFLKSGEGCDGIVFYNKENPDVVLIVQNQQRSMLQDYPPLFDCWAIYYNSSRQPSASEQETKPVFVGGRTMVIKSLGSNSNDLAVTQMYGLKNDIIEQYEVRSNFGGNLYQFSLIYPKVLSAEVHPIFDSIVSSVEYFKKDKLLVAEPTAWKMFTSFKLGFSFEYPEEWGAVKEKITDYSSGQNQPYGYVADRGQAYVLSFANSSIYAVGQSVDFGAGREFVHTDYKGDPKRPAEVISDVGINLTARCSESGYPAGPPASHVIKFNLPGKEISGVMLVFPVLSIADNQKYNKLIDDFMKNEIDCRDATWPNQGSEKAKQVMAKLIAKEKEISEMLHTGVNFDKESQVNLAVYNRILKSAKFVN